MEDRNLELTNRMLELNVKIDRLDQLMVNFIDKIEVVNDLKERDKFDKEKVRNIYFASRAEADSYDKMRDSGRASKENKLKELNNKINELKKSIENDMVKNGENNGSN